MLSALFWLLLLLLLLLSGVVVLVVGVVDVHSSSCLYCVFL